MGTPYCLAFVTVPDSKVAEKVTMALLKDKLAACINRVPNIRSSYWWQGKIEHSDELMLVVKTRTELVPEITVCVKKNHPYAIPEVVSFPISDGLPAYLDWVGASTRPTKSKVR